MQQHARTCIHTGNTTLPSQHPHTLPPHTNTHAPAQPSTTFLPTWQTAHTHCWQQPTATLQLLGHHANPAHVRLSLTPGLVGYCQFCSTPRQTCGTPPCMPQRHTHISRRAVQQPYQLLHHTQHRCQPAATLLLQTAQRDATTGRSLPANQHTSASSPAEGSQPVLAEPVHCPAAPCNHNRPISLPIRAPNALP